MPDTKVGLGQITNPTPKWATWVFRIVLYAAAVMNIIVTVIAEIPADMQLILLKYSAYAVTLTHMFTRLFGIPTPKIPEYNPPKQS